MISQRKSSGLIKRGSLTLATVFATLSGCGGDVRVGSIERLAEQGDGVQKGAGDGDEQQTPAPEDTQRSPSAAQCIPTPVTACADHKAYLDPILFNCDTKEAIRLDPDLEDNRDPTCDEVYDMCDAYAAAHPGESVACHYRGFWPDTWVYRKELTPGACNPPSSLIARCTDPCAGGEYVRRECDSFPPGFDSVDPNYTCFQALNECWVKSYAYPSLNFRCTFNGQILYSRADPSLPGAADCQ